MIHFEGIRHRILEIPYLSLGPGTTALIGLNGAGKSTFLRLCAGVELPEKGTVFIDEVNPREREVGWVDENPERTLLFEQVIDEMASTLRFRGIPCLEVQTQINAVIGHLGISSLIDKSTWYLSAGEKVLVALGAALVGNPMTLILDEVDSHLDPLTEIRLQAVLADSGIRYILISTQHMETAAMANQVVYLERGKVQYHGSPTTVFALLEDTCFYPLSWRTHR